jgi:DNA-binding CsgD family transcriptional regulator
MTNVSTPDRSMIAALILFAAIGGLIAVDVVTDLRQGTTASHIVFEVTAMAVAVAGAAFLLLRLRVAQKEHQRLGRDLHVARAEAERWRSEAHELLAGLGAAVSEQFDRWALTAAEQEVGLLLLKGLSHKEVADVRSTSERTVRQQALAIYRKAGLGGRAELAAFFFEDLLLPVDTAPRRTEGEEKS